MEIEPRYLKFSRSGELTDRAERLMRASTPKCRICPRECSVDRADPNGAAGECGADARLRVSSAFAHFGEESELVGLHGSGAIFFANCNLKCIFCQNYDISHHDSAKTISIEELALIMIELQNLRCHNINLVTPTHYAHQIVAAIALAAAKGLKTPIVWNCGGYDSAETLETLDGIVDIYMPDLKFADDEIAAKYLDAPDYASVAKANLKEMRRQVGDLELDAFSVARRGMIVRHLLMPGLLDQTKKIIDFIADEISTDCYLNLMGQYRPAHEAGKAPPIDRALKSSELEAAREMARERACARAFENRF